VNEKRKIVGSITILKMIKVLHKKRNLLLRIISMILKIFLIQEYT